MQTHRECGAIIGQDSGDQAWTVLSLCEWGGKYLSDRGFDEGRLHTELLLAHVLGLKRIDLYLKFDRPLAKTELGRFKELFKRRLTHEPLQQILGEAFFMGLALEVNRDVLVPRPETEILAEEGIKFLKGLRRERPKVLDIGTGSGNIAVALKHFLPEAEVLGVDASPAALDVARRNGERHVDSGVAFELRDVKSVGFPEGPFDLVISNPPYVPESEYGGLQPEVRTFEPRSATTDGEDGLSFFRTILRAGREILDPQGTVMLEIGYGQSAEVGQIAAGFGYAECRFVNDYAGIPRVAICAPGRVARKGGA